MKILAFNSQNNKYTINQNQSFGMRFSPNAVAGIKASDFKTKTVKMPKILKTLEDLKERDDGYVLADFMLDSVKKCEPYEMIDDIIHFFHIEPGIITQRKRPYFRCKIENTAGLTLYNRQGEWTFRKILKELQFLASDSFDRRAKRIERRHARTVENKLTKEQKENNRLAIIHQRVDALCDTSVDDTTDEILQGWNIVDKETRSLVRALIAGKVTNPSKILEAIKDAEYLRVEQRFKALEELLANQTLSAEDAEILALKAKVG